MNTRDSTAPRGRVWASILMVIGAFAVSVAVLLPTYAVPHLRKIPLDIDADTVSLSPSSALIDAEQVARGGAGTVDNVPLRFRVYVTAQEPSNSEIVTLQAATSMTRADRPETDQAPLSATVDRVTLDRASAQPRDDPPATIQTVQNEPASVVSRHGGLQYQFPFRTQRSSYPYFDAVARKTVPLEYVDDDRVEGGMRLYHFRYSLAPVNLRATQPQAKLTLAASAWGLDGTDPVTFDLFYETQRDVWVEPVTGAVIAVEDKPHRFLARSVDDPLAVTTLAADTAFDEPTLERTTERANAAREQLTWAGRNAPIAFLVLGIVALTAGIMIGRRAYRTRGAVEHIRETLPVTPQR